MPGWMLVDPGEVGLPLDTQVVLRWSFLIPAVFSPFGPALASALKSKLESNPARRNVLLCTRPHSRGARRPSGACMFRPKEGVGNAGCSMHPRPRMQEIESIRVSSPQVHRSNPAFPHAMVFTVSFALSLVIGLFVTVAGGIASANLTPASRRQDHTTSPSASVLFVSSTSASTASRPAFVTIAIAPRLGRDGNRDIPVSTGASS
jgi:hypothetical protein